MNFITFDIDWAPDFTIKYCADLCIKYQTHCIFFATHNSPVIENLKNEELFEIGIHPNLNQNSSQGKNIEEILDNFKSFLPHASCMRTHSLYQSTPLFEKIAKHNPMIKYDFSTLMYKTQNLNSSYLYMSNKKVIKRIPFFFEDDVSFNDPTWDWPIDFNIKNGLKIFNFHPALVYLNSKDNNAYEKIKKNLINKKKENFEKLKFNKYGMNNYFIDLLKTNEFINFKQLIEI